MEDISLNSGILLMDEQTLTQVPFMPLDVFTAAGVGNCEAIKEALQLDCASLHCSNSGGWNALMYAAYYGHEDAVLLLHSCAVNLHARNTSGLTALMLASVCGHPSVVKVLIECGSLLEVRDDNGWTAMFHAVHSRHCNVLQILLKGGANTNACDLKKGETPLLLACATGDVELVEMLLEAGADPTIADYTNTTPFDVAKKLHHTAMADILVKSIKDLGAEGRCDLAQLLEHADLSSYLALFQEQAVNREVFLTLSDADLKECGVSKMGPRRKMTALISRWHNNAPLMAAPQNIYADKLGVELQELTLKYQKNFKESRALQKMLLQERELRASTESLVVEARARLLCCHRHSVQLARSLILLHDTIVNAADHVSSNRTSATENTTPRHVHSCQETAYLRNNTLTPTLSANYSYVRDAICLSHASKVSAINGNTTAKNGNQQQFDKHNSLQSSSNSSPSLIEYNKSIHQNDVLRTDEECIDYKDATSTSKYVFYDPTRVSSENNNSYLTYVDNVKNFRLDSNNSRFTNYSNHETPISNNFNFATESRPMQEMKVDAKELATNLDAVYLPPDYRNRPPSLCFPKVGSEVKQCLQIIRYVAELSDPNVPRVTGSSDPDIPRVSCSTETNVQQVSNSTIVCSSTNDSPLADVTSLTPVTYPLMSNTRATAPPPVCSGIVSIVTVPSAEYSAKTKLGERNVSLEDEDAIKQLAACQENQRKNMRSQLSHEGKNSIVNKSCIQEIGFVADSTNSFSYDHLGDEASLSRCLQSITLVPSRNDHFYDSTFSNRFGKNNRD